MSNFLANNAALGRLPTLGLGKINLDQVQQDDNNKFNVMKDTEKLLVARELDRELKDLKKYEKDNLRIWEKQISTRIDRAGTIRQINSIPASLNKDNDKRKAGMQAIQSDADLQNANKQKLNIFDTQDSTVLKTENLARLGHDERGLVPIDEQSMSDA